MKIIVSKGPEPVKPWWQNYQERARVLSLLSINEYADRI